MNIDDVLIGPIVSEKSTAMRERATFCFRVHMHANKIEIAKALTSRFGVRVIKCRTIIMKPKPKRVRNIVGSTARIKKAYISLHKDDTISLFEGV